MGVSTGDLLQLIDNQSYLGQQCLNVYYYRWFSAPVLDTSYLALLNDDWESKVMNEVIKIQSDALTHNSREWKNLSNGVDIFTEGSVVEGLISAPDTSDYPSYVSAGFLLQRDSLVTRNGYKRFAGLTEGEVDGNESAIGAPTIASIEAALAAFLEVGLIEVAAPVIPKRPLNPPLESYVYSSVQSARFRGIGTQNSRKKGRGI